ncbi:MAG: D-alanyl-D-alanine carboxypeptidase/D-alanyl-D-alanine-endopeptidase [Saprospiraceae bacterium]|nr:D-alanyl-D-alanine carboxypeptidase/D-alanyl-D-alanine-endopeptidase [Saprospiraceae bacterium]
MKHYKLIILLFFTVNLISQDLGKINASIERYFNKGIFTSSNASVSVIDISSQEEIIAYRSQKNLVPASSLKLFINLIALQVLGPNFTYETTVAYSGKIRADGTLEGDIIIVGGGDPSLGSKKIKGTYSMDQFLELVCNKILSVGINCIKGNLIIDESIFDSYPVAPTWQWNDLGNYYATGAWGFNINENLYAIGFNNNGPIGSVPKINYVKPSINNLKLSNEISIDSSHTGDQAYIFGGPYNYDKRIVGTIPQGKNGFQIKGSIPDPPKFFGEKLRQKLISENIQSDDLKVLVKPYKKKYKIIWNYKSPPLKSIARLANLESHNLFTESNLKIMGLKERGQGSGQNGIAVVKKHLKSYGINNSNIIIHDGSGLSARNNISSFAMASFLSKYADEMSIKEATLLLPKGGYQGTVKHMFKNKNIKGRIWLKSGSMEGVQSYSGYFYSNSKKWYSFSIIVNGFSVKGRRVRKAIEAFISDLYQKI